MNASNNPLATALDAVSRNAAALAKAEAFLSFNGDPDTMPPELTEDDGSTWRDAFIAWAENRGWDDEDWRLCLIAFGLMNVFDPIAIKDRDQDRIGG